MIGGATSGTIGFVVNQQLAPEMPVGGDGVAVAAARGSSRRSVPTS